MAMREKIGFIGLGSMGRPMASSLLRKGFELMAFDTDKPQVDVLAERGARPAASIAALIDRRRFTGFQSIVIRPWIRRVAPASKPRAL